MAPDTMAAFIESEIKKGASENTVRRLKATVKMVYEFLPEDKLLTRERLLEWRVDLNERGYAYQTIQNFVKWINIYLDYVGLSEIRFNRGKGKDISGMEFGYLTAIEPTEKRHRKDVVWLCRCRCGTMLEMPATRLILNNTLSCGCIQKEKIKRANKYFGGTSLEKSLKDPVTSTRSMSGYVGVTRKRDKWQAYITYKRQHISLGVYEKLEDAVKARARGKEAVMADATELLKIYEAIHENDEALPSKSTLPKNDLPYEPRVINNQPTTAARRVDNKSGYTGITFRKNKWESRICYHKRRYMLGRFDTLDEAISERTQAEEYLKRDPDAFVEYYSKNYKSHAI
jgi:hypothetical protein